MQFTGRDLALALPDQVGDATSLRFTKDETADDVSGKVLRPRIDTSKKVAIYRAGQVPQWGADEEQSTVTAVTEGGTRQRRKNRFSADPAVGNGDERSQGFGSIAGDRLEAFGSAQLLTDADEDSNRRDKARARARARAREVVEAEIITGQSDDSDADIEGAYRDRSSRNDDVQGDVAYTKKQVQEEEDDDDVATRRARIRARLQQQQQSARTVKEPELLAREDEVEIEQKLQPMEEDNSDEWETDTDDSDNDGEVDEGALLRPVFVPKNKRETLKQAEAKEEAARLRAEQEQHDIEARKRETRHLVAEEIRREQDTAASKSMNNSIYGNSMSNSGVLDGNASDADMPDDTDDPNELLEFEGWKVREMQRLSRDKEEREIADKEKKETERRRNMTEEERRAEDKALGKAGNKHAGKDKTKWGFMQRYYHKGVFYVDEDSIKDSKDVRLRDNTAATGEDKFNKEAMPKIMQVKNFGRSGQTKWTHLAAEDTTAKDAPFMLADPSLRAKYESKMGGVGDVDAPFRRLQQRKQAQEGGYP